MRPHRIATLVMIVVVLSACGGGELGAVPEPTTTSSPSANPPEGEATSTTDKPAVTLPSTASTPPTTTTAAASPTTTSIAGASMSTTTGPGSPIQVPESFLAAVIQDAAARQSLDPASVTAISGQPVDWADASLGCPEPSRSYIQVITPGYLVVVDAGGVTLEYHLNRQGEFKQCSGGTFYPPSGY